MSTILFAILCSILMVIAIVGVFVPMIPGIPLAWLGLFVYAIATGFERISITTVVVFFILAGLITLLEFLAPMLGAIKYQASIYGILGAFIGLIIGVVFFSFWGIIIGPFVGAFTLELIAKRQIKGAFKSAVGTLIGFIAGTLMKTVFILVMVGFFIASWF